MENFTLDRVKATTILDLRRESSKGGYPVRYRVTYNRQSVYFPCMVMFEDDWARLKTARTKELVKSREMIQNGFKNITDNIEDLVKSGSFSLEALTKRLSKGRKNSLMTAYDNKIKELNEAGQIGTAIGYKCSKNSIVKYVNKDLMFSDITLDWLRKYETHLIEEGKTRTTVKMYIECIRALMNQAKQEKIITEGGYPFGKGKFEIKKGVGRKLALTLPQIKKVIDFPLVTDYEKRCRDLWFFSYLCNGVNFHDLLKLKYKNISGGEIYFIRHKTMRTTGIQKEVVATLLPEMNAIIKKWGNPSREKDDYIFPYLKPGMTAIEEKIMIQNVIRLTNKKMKAISDALKLETISTYTARHSFATVLKRSGANIAYISESLGHSDLRTTENYLSSFETEERKKNASLLTKFNRKQTKKTTKKTQTHEKK